MSKVSVIIPARNEEFATRTVTEVRNAAAGEIEVVLIMDGPGLYLAPNPRSWLKIIKKNKAEGMRSAINDGVAASDGEYIMKLDAHCKIGKGFDEILKKDCEDNWIVISRYYELEPKSWKVDTLTLADYFYMTCPWKHPKFFIIQNRAWYTRTKSHTNLMIDEALTFHGGMWFMSRKHWDWLGGMENEGYTMMAAEPLELGLKTWLGGGKVMVNKNTWYAHVGMGFRHTYSVEATGFYEGMIYAANYWIQNRWEKRIHDFDWLIDRFWPLPTENNHHKREMTCWPDDWRKKYIELNNNL